MATHGPRRKGDIPDDVILHSKVRNFLKYTALGELTHTALTREEQEIRRRCVVEAEYHKALAAGRTPNKEKFLRMVYEQYGWDPKQRKGGKPKDDNA